MSKPNSPEGYFLFQDASGQLFIADSLDGIPEAYRSMAKRFSVDEAKALADKVGQQADLAQKTAKDAEKQVIKGAKEVQHQVGDIVPFVKALDLPSLAVGFGAALAVVLVLSVVKRTGAWALKLGLLAMALALFAGGYFGWLRRAAGLGGDGLSGPTEIINDAKDAANKANQRLKEQERALKKLEGK